jgi:DNA polymerase III psi subunit
MSLDNIQLTPLLIEKLYSKSLVDLNTTMATAPKRANEGFNFLGNNEKNILIVINEPETVYLQDNDLNLLIGILTACKLSLADIALLNFDKNKHADYSSLNNTLHPSTIILFGTEPVLLDFPLNFPHFQLQPYNGQHYLAAPALKNIGADVGLKKQLWLALQKHFN